MHITVHHRGGRSVVERVSERGNRERVSAPTPADVARIVREWTTEAGCWPTVTERFGCRLCHRSFTGRGADAYLNNRDECIACTHYG